MYTLLSSTLNEDNELWPHHNTLIVQMYNLVQVGNG